MDLIKNHRTKTNTVRSRGFTRVLWLIYNLLFFIAFILILPMYLLHMRKRGGYARHFWQRIGIYDRETLRRLGDPGRVWIHAVSVGEMFIALKLMEMLRAARPEQRFVVTVATSTGHAVAERNLRAADALLYFPVDFPPVTRRVLNLLRPACLVLMEGEIWPNLIRYCSQRKIPVALINARMSDSSYAGYRKLRVFARRILPQLSLVCAQSQKDADRLLDLGASPDGVRVLGSAKYDVAEKDKGDAVAILRQAGIGERALLLLGGSTWEGEEEALVAAYRELKPHFPELALVLVPRHVERSGRVEEVIARAGLSCARRSELKAGESLREDGRRVLLVDTTGELRKLYACADIIFVGKSLTAHGGQNLLEAAVYAKAILVGPHMENFPVVMADFRQAQAVIQLRGAEELAPALRRLLESADERRELGRRAAATVEARRGALARSASLLLDLMP